MALLVQEITVVQMVLSMGRRKRRRKGRRRRTVFVEVRQTKLEAGDSLVFRFVWSPWKPATRQ